MPAWGSLRTAQMSQERADHPQERRLVTILFADLVGYTSVSETRDPELVQSTLSICFDRLSAEIKRFGGYVNKVVGDEIMALFGAPKAQEDDAGKAVAAALAMHHALDDLTPQLTERLGHGLSIRIGINTGLVVTGAVGPGGYTVTGDAVNVAARLEKAAQPGAVMVGDMTRRLARRRFQWGNGRELTVKGRAEPVICYGVEALAPAHIGLVPAPSETPFVGREQYLRRIRELWSATKAGPARVLQVVGEAGVGKTRLLAHHFAMAGTAPEQILYARADTPPRTFGPLLQLLPSLRDNLAPSFRERLEALARAHELAEVPEVEPGWLVDGLAEVIEALTRNGPVAFVLDDMHRADGATVAVVQKLLPRLAALPVLSVLLRQPKGRQLHRLPTEDSITLEPLAEEEARGLVLAAAPGVSVERATDILSQAGGNPLYLELLAAAAIAAPEEARLPESLETAVVARVDELDETSRQLLLDASIFGQMFYEEPLKIVATVSERLHESLAQLCEVGLLDELPGTDHRGYRFRHSVVQQALYEAVLRRKRAELHLRAAESLELVREEGIEVEPEQMAFHYREAGHTERAAAYYLAAGERADRLQAPSEARNYRRTASRLLNMASLAGVYSGHRRPAGVTRAAAAAVQASLALLLVLPEFLLFATRRPQPNLLTLGLPLEVIDFNLSSVLLAVALGGLPLLLAGIAFAHLAVPILMRRKVSLPLLIRVALSGWLLGLASVLLGFGALVGLLRFGALDRLSSMYVGAATLRLLLGDHSLVIAVVIGTLLVAVAWTALLRSQARGWASVRRTPLGPRQIEEGRRWASVRQLGLLVAGGGALAWALLTCYQFRVLPDAGAQVGLSPGLFAGVLVAASAAMAAGVVATSLASRRLRAKIAVRHLGLFGFEVPLILAIVFGLVVWFGMRQAVIVSANEVDTPGNIGAFNRLVKIFPDVSMAYYLRGERYLAEGDFEHARVDLDRAIELDDGFPASYLARGRVLIQEGDLEAAKADGDRLVELRPDHPAGHAIRAWAEAKQGDLTSAAADFDAATQPLPAGSEAWDAYFVRCLALAAVKDYERAEPDCQRVLELNPDHMVSLDELTDIAFSRGDYGAAVEYTTKQLAIQPGNATVWLNRGTAYRDMGRYQEAESDLSQAIALDSDKAGAYSNRAIARLYLDLKPEAMADANRAVELDQSELYTRLYVARYSGQYETAIEDATTLLQEGQPTAYLLSSRGQAYVDSGQVQLGLEDINAALALDPTYTPGYDRRGYAYFVLGDYQRAAADLDEALRGLETLPPEAGAELYYHRALLSQAQGHLDDARAEIDEARKLVEIPDVRRQIEGLLQSIGGPG